ncbi:hypothetical protein P43SY_002906 [Pythium insidiosum]|uniref:Uncharacterized protein n=1 Tax=Pythium insidiosum TaxID=114742 RepID=A0AAD5M2Q8_PYTIN|nr:hypothetical protein P43SY_002906 [Pythium insidiosum]
MTHRVNEQEAAILFLVIQYLRDLKLHASVATVLRESGVDPIWLCGPSREVTQLREAVLGGQWDVVDAFLRTLLAPLSRSSSAKSLNTQRDVEDALKQVEQIKYLERFHSSSLDERKEVLLAQGSAPLHRCNSSLQAGAAPTWDQHDGRLQLYERLVRLLRDDIEIEDEEHKFLAMPRRQLVSLLNDALLLHRQRDGPTARDYVSVQALSGDVAVRDPANESLLTSSEDSFLCGGARSVDLSLCPEDLMPRRQNPLVMSMNWKRSGRPRETTKTSQADDPREKTEDSKPLAMVDATQQTDHGNQQCHESSTQTAPADQPSRACSTQTVAVACADNTTQSDAPNSEVIAELESSPPESPSKCWDTGISGKEVDSQPEDPYCLSQEASNADRASEPAPLLSYSNLSADDVACVRVIAQAREAHAVRAMALAGDGSEMVIGTNGRALRVFELDRSLLADDDAVHAATPGALLPLLPVALEKHKHHSSPIYCAAYSASQELIATGAADASIKVLGRWTHREQWIRGHGGKCRAVHFAGASTLWTAASADFALRCWDLAASDPLCVRRLEGHVGEIQAMVPGPSAHTFLTTAMDRTIRLWDSRAAQCARLVARFPSTHATPALALALAPTTPRLASGHEDGSVRLWDLRQTTAARPLTTLGAHQDECRAVSWSPDGAWLLSASFDGTMRLYEQLASGELSAVTSCRQHEDKVLQAQWHPTLPAIATTGGDKLVKVWGFRRR